MKWFMILTAAWIAAAATANAKRKPAAEGIEMDVHAVLMESRRDYHLAFDGRQYTLTVQSAVGKRNVRLANEDGRFLFAEYLKLPQTESVPEACYRSRVDIHAREGKGTPITKSSCIGLNTVTSAAYARFLELLQAAVP